MQISEKLSQLVKERGKILAERNETLEDMVKKAESLLITLDHALNEVNSMSNSNAAHAPQYRGLPRDKLLEVNQRKAKHQESLSKLREFYEGSLQQQQRIEQEIAEEEERMQREIGTLEDSLEEG